MRKVSALLFLVLMSVTGCGQLGEAQTALVSSPADQSESAAVLIETQPAVPASASPTPASEIAAKLAGTPFVFPPTVVPAPICENAPPTYLILHERARVTNDDPKPLNVRDSAGLSGKIVGQLETLDIFMVIDGPRCGDEYTWFKIRAGETEGWVAEGDFETYYVEPYIP